MYQFLANMFYVWKIRGEHISLNRKKWLMSASSRAIAQLLSTFQVAIYNPRCSMYGIFAYIYHKHQPNVGKYTIHGSYVHLCTLSLDLILPCHDTHPLLGKMLSRFQQKESQFLPIWPPLFASDENHEAKLRRNESDAAKERKLSL